MNAERVEHRDIVRAGPRRQIVLWGEKVVSTIQAMRRGRRAILVVLSAAILSSVSSRAHPACVTITAPALEIAAVDCTQAQVWSQLHESRRFPDVFAGSGKMTNLCYVSTAPVPAFIGDSKVTISSLLSGWTTDFQPFLFGGPDNLGTVVTELTFADVHGRALGRIFTRDTIDLSQIFTTGTASEEDVIVGGSAVLEGARGTYRATDKPEDPQAAKVKLANLSGLICFNE
jgi:hypothetical protein